MRKLACVAAGAAALGLAVATGGAASADDTGSSLVRHGTFAVWDDASRPPAVSYDPALVPVGARIVVAKASASQHTKVGLAVRGLRPNREYGAHVHTRPCGRTGADAGPHYQNMADPVQPSVDPAYANPENEVWLDFTTDGKGNGAARSKLGWNFRSGGAQSVVIHEHHTHTGPGQAGTAGARLACFTVPF